MVDKMKNYATHGLKHNMIWFSTVIHRKQMPSVTTLALGLQPRQRHGKVWVENVT
jgi:hypothetical protein